MRNKANLGESAGRSRRSVVQTKPIPGGAGPPPRRAKCAKQTQFGGESRETNPIWPGVFGLRRAKCAKQSQLTPRPNCQGRRRGRLYKQTQFARKWLKEKRLWCIGHPGQLRGYKPRPHRPIWKPLVQTKPILRQGFVQSAGARQSRQTNPICPRTGRKWRGRGTSAESNAPNKPNFNTWHGHPARESEPWAGRPCHYSAGPAGPPGAGCTNKPNVRQEKLGKEDVHGYVLNGNLL
jgi:hypothetical protein